MLTGLLGTGSSVLVAGIALLIAKERRHLPGRQSGEIALVVAIILMLLAGVLTTYLGMGAWVVSAIHTVEGFFGPAGRVLLVLFGCALLVKVVLGISRKSGGGGAPAMPGPGGRAASGGGGRGGDSVLWVAFWFPLVSAAINAGFFLTINTHLKQPADMVQAMLRAKLGA